MSRDLSDPLLLFAQSSPGRVPAYVAHFGLERSPFAKTMDPYFLYAGTSYATAYEQIGEALRRGDGLIVLTGESGTGKTTLCHRVIDSLSGPTLLSVIDSSLGFEDLVRRLLSDFGIVAPETTEDGRTELIGYDLILILNRFLAANDSDGRTILVLDDVHGMQPAVLAQLRSLTNLKTAKGHVLQIVLIGQPPLEVLFKRPEVRQLQQRVNLWCRLTPLATSEIEPFVRHRMAAAGHAATDPTALLSPQAIQSLSVISRGVPGTLNRLGDRALELAYERKDQRIESKDVIAAASHLKVAVPASMRIRPAVVAVALVAIVAAAAVPWGLRHVPAFGRMLTISSSAPPAVAGLTPPEKGGGSVASTEASPGNGVVATPAAASLPAADSFLIMVAAFQKQQSATETVDALAELDLPAFSRRNGAWFVVMVGPYLTLDEAKDAQEKIDSRRFPQSKIQKQTASDNAGQ